MAVSTAMSGSYDKCRLWPIATSTQTTLIRLVAASGCLRCRVSTRTSAISVCASSSSGCISIICVSMHQAMHAVPVAFCKSEQVWAAPAYSVSACIKLCMQFLLLFARASRCGLDRVCWLKQCVLTCSCRTVSMLFNASSGCRQIKAIVVVCVVTGWE